MRQKIGFIGGGQMAEALIKGIITSGLYKNEDILVAEPNESRRDHLESLYSVKAHYSNLPVFENCRVIMLAVKPQTMSMLLDDCQERVQPQHILISIAAGLPISFYIDKLGKPKTKMVRVMPNTPLHWCWKEHLPFPGTSM